MLPHTNDVRKQRDCALEASKQIETRISEVLAQIKAHEAEQQKLSAQHQQLIANLIATQALTSGLNIALGEEPLPNSLPNGVLSATR